MATPIAAFIQSNLDNPESLLRTHIKTALTSLSEGKSIPASLVIPLEHPADPIHGDYASSIALVLQKDPYWKERFSTPFALAEAIAAELQSAHRDMIGKVQAVRPGFVNIWFQDQWLQTKAAVVAESFSPVLSGKKIMVEFAHPNTHKEFHIGHLRNIAIGESVVRILKANGAEVFRANYEGDVGLHVAKAIWGTIRNIKNKISNIKNDEELIAGLLKVTSSMTPAQKAKFLGEGYALGSKMYDEDEAASFQ